MIGEHLDWDNLRYFLAVARAGKLTAAARRLGQDHTTVGRRIVSLESAFRSKLFERRPDGYRLTETGQRLYEKVKSMESSVCEIQRDFAGQTQHVEGVVRIGAPDDFGNLFLAKHIGELQRLHPGLKIELITLPYSRVRERLFGEEKPRFSGQIAYRGLAAAERVAHLRLPFDVTNWVGPGGHFVHYYVSTGRFLNFIAVSEEASWTREQWSDRGSIRDAVKNYEGWHPQIATILTAVDETFKWALFDRNPLPEWTRGRVALLGDACHPMLPFMAQGAAQAIEDGATLAACLKQTVFNVPTALQAYVSSRKPRTTALQERSQAFSRSFHLHDGPEQQARDHTYATVGLRGNREAMNALYGHDADAKTTTYAER